jgi:hypothetical protein
MCSYFSQGCAGGFSFELGRYAKKHQLVSVEDWESFSENMSVEEKCSNFSDKSKTD